MPEIPTFDHRPNLNGIPERAMANGWADTAIRFIKTHHPDQWRMFFAREWLKLALAAWDAAELYRLRDPSERGIIPPTESDA